MARTRFIGRTAELQAIEQEFDRRKPSLVIILGRRRVGKSRLIIESLAKRPAIYYQATKVTASESLALFKAEIAGTTGNDPLLEALSDWQGTLSYLETLAAKRKKGLIVVLDEFPYLCEADSALPSVIQKFWDRIWESDSPIKLVLCGSKISFMETLLAEKNPLHGRQSLKLDIAPLSYRETGQFLPRWSHEAKLMAYAVFGGNPFYLSQLDPAAGLKQNVLDLILSKGAPLADEPVNLLQAELREVARYATILRAVADGCNSSKEIIGRVREIASASALTPYIEKLAELRLIRIVRSLDASERERNRRYQLDDPFLAFWYRFFLPNASAIAAGHGDQVYRHVIEPHLDTYMGHLFEWICRDHARLHLQEVTSVPAQIVGQLWAANYDIDVAGKFLDGSALYGECKWWHASVGENVLDHLMNCASQCEYGRKAPRHHLVIYSKAGFTRSLLTRAQTEPSVHLLTLSDLMAKRLPRSQ